MDTVRCEECGGSGVDPGSLREPEECPRCCGAGLLIAPAEVKRSIARKLMGRAETAERIPAGWFEERAYRTGE